MKMSLIESTCSGLACFLYSGLQRRLEPGRLARAGYALLAGGCSIRGNFPGDSIVSYLVAAQQWDGGWVDVEETLWCLGYLSAFGNRYEAGLASGRKWLDSVRLPCGAWGKTDRDQPRIPLTALASVLVPEVVNANALKWLANQWENDLASPTSLTYKGTFFLISQSHPQAPPATDLIDHTIAYLGREQEDDGGFGPWKGHPAGSDPWSTGTVLWGLSKAGALVPMHTVEQALAWLESKQLPNGLWPYHYLDDGAAMALIGISNTLPLLAEQ